MPPIRIDFSETSTIQGLMIGIFGLSSIIAYFIGKDPVPLVTIGMTISGAIGALYKDKHSDPDANN